MNPENNGQQEASYEWLKGIRECPQCGEEHELRI